MNINSFYTDICDLTKTAQKIPMGSGDYDQRFKNRIDGTKKECQELINRHVDISISLAWASVQEQIIKEAGKGSTVYRIEKNLITHNLQTLKEKAEKIGFDVNWWHDMVQICWSANKRRN